MLHGTATPEADQTGQDLCLVLGMGKVAPECMGEEGMKRGPTPPPLLLPILAERPGPAVLLESELTPRLGSLDVAMTPATAGATHREGQAGTYRSLLILSKLS